MGTALGSFDEFLLRFAFSPTICSFHKHALNISFVQCIVLGSWACKDESHPSSSILFSLQLGFQVASRELNI